MRLTGTALVAVLALLGGALALPAPAQARHGSFYLSVPGFSLYINKHRHRHYYPYRYGRYYYGRPYYYRRYRYRRHRHRHRHRRHYHFYLRW